MIAAELVYMGTAKQIQRQFGFAPQQLEDARDAVAAEGAEAIQIGSPGHDGPRTHRQRLRHLRASANAAVEDEFEPIANTVGQIRDKIDRCRPSVELATAMVGDDDSRADVAAAFRATSTACRPSPLMVRFSAE